MSLQNSKNEEFPISLTPIIQSSINHNLWFPQSSPIYDWCLVTWGNPGACAGHPPLNCFSLKNLSEIRHGKCWSNAEVNWPGVYHPKKYWPYRPYRPHQDSRNSPRSDTHQIILIESLWSTSKHLLDSFFFGGNPHIYPLGSHGWEVHQNMTWTLMPFPCSRIVWKKNSFETTN